VVPLKDDDAGQAAAAALTDVLQGVMFDQLCRDLMDALLVGFSVVEVIWTVRDNLVVPKRFAKRAQRRFRFVDLMTNSRPRCAW
jgi:phage gp29-like protein